MTGGMWSVRRPVVILNRDLPWHAEVGDFYADGVTSYVYERMEDESWRELSAAEAEEIRRLWHEDGELTVRPIPEDDAAYIRETFGLDPGAEI